jgi:hypothetical protein
MKFLKEKELRNLSNDDLVNHIKSLAEMLSTEEGVESVELDSCQEDDDGKEIVYNGTIIGIDSVVPTGLNYNDVDGEVIGTISFEEAKSLDKNLLVLIVRNYQGTIVNEVL